MIKKTKNNLKPQFVQITNTSHCPGALGSACNLLNTLSKESTCVGSNYDTLVVAIVNNQFYHSLPIK